MQKLHLSRWSWQRRLIGLRCDRHFGLLHRHQVQVDFCPTVVDRFLDRIGDKDQPPNTVKSWLKTKTSLPLMVTAALSRIRALGCTSDGLYGNTKLNGACLPSVRTARWATTFDGASAREASDSVTVNTASGGSATFCLIQMVPETLGC